MSKNVSLLPSGWVVIDPNTKYGYLSEDKKTLTDYHNAGCWDLREAIELCVNYEHARLQPDPSEKWLVLIFNQGL